jgi:epoxide hydrolase 4
MLLRLAAAASAAVLLAPLMVLHLLWRCLRSPDKARFLWAARRDGPDAAAAAALADGGDNDDAATDGPVVRSLHLRVGANVVHALVAGDPHAPLALLLHGFPESAHSWRHVQAALASTHYVVAIDMPGYGATTKAQPSWWTADEYALPRLVETVGGVITALGRAKAEVLVGHDWGAMVAWAVAGALPERVGALCCVNVPHPAAFRRNFTWRQALRSAYIWFFQLPWLPEAVLSADGYAFLDAALLGRGSGVVNRGAITRADVDAIRWSLSRAGTLTAALNYYRALASPASLAFQRRGWVAGTRRSRYPMPVLQVWGTDDAYLGRELTAGTEDYCAPGGYTLVEIPSCSHWVMWDRPDALVAALRAWMGGGGGKGGAAPAAAAGAAATS